MSLYAFNKVTDLDNTIRFVRSESGPEKVTQRTIQNRRWTFRNQSGEEIPAYAVMEVTGVNDDTANNRILLLVDKPSSSRGIFVFNDIAPVPDANFGTTQLGPQFRAIYKTGETPANGDIYGPDGWELKSGGSLVDVYGLLNATNRVLIGSVRTGGGFPVDLIQTGGSQGNGTTKASWTYTVRREGETDDLETTVDPQAGPHFLPGPSGRHIGRMTAATKGWAHFNENGDLELDTINEWVETKACDPSPASPSV